MGILGESELIIWQVFCGLNPACLIELARAHEGQTMKGWTMKDRP